MFWKILNLYNKAKTAYNRFKEVQAVTIICGKPCLVTIEQLLAYRATSQLPNRPYNSESEFFQWFKHTIGYGSVDFINYNPESENGIVNTVEVNGKIFYLNVEIKRLDTIDLI